MAKHRPDPKWAQIRGKLWERSGGFCEVSSRPLDLETFDAHHRRLKGMGGTSRPLTDSLVNLLALDPEVHNGAPWSVHQRTSWSRLRGYLLSAHVDDDELVLKPYLWHGTTWVIPDEQGDFGVLSARAQRHFWRVLEAATTVPPATRPRGSQYR